MKKRPKKVLTEIKNMEDSTPDTKYVRIRLSPETHKLLEKSAVRWGRTTNKHAQAFVEHLLLLEVLGKQMVDKDDDEGVVSIEVYRRLIRCLYDREEPREADIWAIATDLGLMPEGIKEIAVERGQVG